MTDWPINFWIGVPVKPKQSFEYGCGRGRSKPGVEENARRLAYEIVQRINNRPGCSVGPCVALRVIFCSEWRKNIPKETRRHGFLPKPTSPDLENRIKQLNDVLAERCRLVKNDGQVTCIEAYDWWTDRTGVLIQMREDSVTRHREIFDRLTDSWQRSDAAVA